MSTDRLRYSDLPQPHRALIRQMQKINFGAIENLAVVSSNPCVTDCTKIVRRIKLDADNGPRPECGLEDFVLSRQIIELIETLHELGDGVIRKLDVQGGLPVQAHIEV